MAEQLDLATPITRPSTTNYHLSRLAFDVDGGSVFIELRGPNGEVISFNYNSSTTPTGAALLTSINTANFTTTSLVKRIYQRLTADGFLAGTVSGTPQ